MKHFILPLKATTYLLLILLFSLQSCISLESEPEEENLETIEEESEEENEEENEEETPEFDLDNLQGEWIRVGGNNPVNNGMIIKVIENAGEIVDPVESGFKKDDTKWSGIVAVSISKYEYEELGSDYNYYPSQMFFQEDDTLRIDVNNSGAGNYQKWVKSE